MNIFSMILGKQYNVLTYLPDAVLVVDEKGRIYYANKSAFSLFETSKLKGKNLNDYFIMSFDNILEEKNNDYKQTVKLVTDEKITKITDVKISDVSANNKKRYILTICDNTRDYSIMDELIAEKQAHKVLNHTKNILLTKMTNYISTPLHSVVGFSRAMLEGLSGELNEKQLKYLEIINNNSTDVLLFINKLIELSKVESDIYSLDYQNFDAASLVSVIANETEVKLNGKDIHFYVNTAELTKPNCYSDKSALSAIITNLTDNAISLTETGTITLNVSNPSADFLYEKGYRAISETGTKSYIAFDVLCKGIDTAPYVNEDIFDPYLCADKNSKKYLLQSILLCSTKKLIEKLNGEMWINNEYSNQISFSFIIPADKATVETAGLV